MKNYFLLLIAFATPQFLFPQCTVSIPANAVVVNNDTTVGMVNQIWWVCSGDTLNGSGVYNTYYVESGGALDMSGIEKIVYLKSGASINCSGIDDTIYYEPGAIINCSGNHVDIPCSQIVFDYSNAPVPGCNATSIGTVNPLNNSLHVSPNPASNQLQVKFSSSKGGVASLLVRNVLGEIILISADNIKIGENVFDVNISGLANGIYAIIIIHNGVTYTIKTTVNHS